jgi:hypothetical protein
LSITKKNHINPCFWTAIWNRNYYEKFKVGNHINEPSREQLLYFLETVSNKTLINKADNIHCEKNLGLAEMQPEKVKEFCKRYFPDEYESFAKDMEDHPETLFMDFENHFTGMEGLPMYSVLLKTIQSRQVTTVEDKTWLTLFLLNHRLRSHVFINSMTEFYKKQGIEKFELFWLLKWSMADPKFQLNETVVILHSKWTIYTTERKVFPLSDNPIIVTRDRIVATLAPDMVLFVDRKRSKPDLVTFKRGISWLKYRAYKKMTIAGAIKGLIFYDKEELEKWKKSKWWVQRRDFLSKNKEYNKLVVRDGLKELWEIDSISNRLK